jgi:2-oxo-3-hexenedioate decarboxylase
VTGVSSSELGAIAARLLDASESASTMAPITATHPGFGSADADAVLARIAAARTRRGWEPVGRKIGFTNRTIWELYGVDRPMWAQLWRETVVRASASDATVVPLGSFVQPRIEPEVVFELSKPVPASSDPLEILSCVGWMAPGFEIVQCHFPDWKFTIADCTADFGLHGALVIGDALVIDDGNRERTAAMLATFEATLSRDGTTVDRGTGANVLDSPALALGHLATVLAGQPEAPALEAGELITTGTLTNAWPVAPGEVWESSYGSLGLGGLTVRFT